MSSSHRILGLPTLLFVRVVALSPGFNLAAFFLPTCLRRVMQFSLLIFILSSFVFQSNTECWLLAVCLRLILCFFWCIPSILPLRLQPCRSLRRGRSGKIRCCFDRILYSCCFLRLSLLSYSAGFSRRLLSLFLRFFCSFSCVFAVFEQ